MTFIWNRSPIGRFAKNLFWGTFDSILKISNATSGALWRRFIRPHSSFLWEATRLFRIIFWYHRFDEFGTHTAIGSRLKIWGPVRIFLGSRCGIFDNVILWGVGDIRIGDGSTIGHNSVIVSRQLVQIGKQCMIAGNCYILDNDHGFTNNGTPINQQSITIKPVIIGDDVWVGAHSVILRGVRIGSGSVIGANSVVTKDIPPNSIAAGNPARVIRQREKQ